MDHNILTTVFYLISGTLATALAYSCTHVITPSSQDSSEDNVPFLSFVECNPVFEICCSEGCCTRFSHAHIWLFAAAMSFVIFVCIFGCWLFCCKEKFRRNRTADRPPPPIDDRVDSPLTLTIPESRPNPARTTNQNANIPVTPPPSYEEATAMR